MGGPKSICSRTDYFLLGSVGLQTEFNLLSTAQTTKLINRSRHKYYEHGQKIGRQLAHQIRISEASRHITEICTGSGNTTKDQSEINQEFKQFYSKLYTTETAVNSVTIQEFFDNLEIPSICQEDGCLLEEPLTLEEVASAIRSLQSSKAPGPDGYTPEFYKTFVTVVAPLLLKVFNQSSETGSLPTTFYQATISLIHNKRERPTGRRILQTSESTGYRHQNSS